MIEKLSNSQVICLGTMSGTSLDGLDLCLVSFVNTKNEWSYEIIAAETVSYTLELKDKLSLAERFSAIDLLQFNNEYGRFLGNTIVAFCANQLIKPQFVASHGHTIFHQPQNGLTLQIGSGACIAAITGMPTVSDFRVLDVALGGQGAPLVPIGDELLFPQYDFCLNLGGFANISTNINGQRIAYDICPVNIVMNHYSRKVGKEFDDGGYLARQSIVHDELLDALNKLSFYSLQAPKSLGKEWVLKEILPLIDSYQLSVPEILRTLCEHVAIQLAKCVNPDQTVLVTGGGAYNTFLISLFKKKSKAKIIIPDDKTIQFKEALIFAFLGLRRIRSEHNCLQSVTGASRNCIGGSVFIG
jgi:anhydro-N-acetylmuramic acid kinase